MDSFSIRHDLIPPEPEITVGREATFELREKVASAAYNAGLPATELRKVICVRLQKGPNSDNTSHKDVDEELQRYLTYCDWYRVYDIIEDIARTPKLCMPTPTSFLMRMQVTLASKAVDDNRILFHELINTAFRNEGIGRQLVDGKVAYRGNEPFESVALATPGRLEQAGLKTTASELRKAVVALSQRPEPDLSGALTHALAAVECVTRKVCGDNATLGELMKRYKERFPPPLGTAITKLWGYASDYARHPKEGEDNNPTLDDVELSVHVTFAIAEYLSKKVGT